MARRQSIAPGADLGRRPDVEKILDDYGVEWSFLSGVPANGFDHERSLKNQARFEPLDERTVDEYAEAVQRGDKFPAVVAYRPKAGAKLVVVDGNHRLVSHERVDVPLDVYELTNVRPQLVALLTFVFNTRHGRPTSEAERTHQAIYLVDNGASVEAAAAAVNLLPRVLKRAIARRNADARADEVGLDRRQWDSLSAAARGRLLNIATDEGFRDAAKLAFAAKLDSNEVFELVTLVNSTKSGTRQVAIVAHERERYADRIGENAGGVLGTADRRAAPPKRRVAMALGQLLALPENDDAIVSAYAVDERPDAAKKLRSAADRLAALAAKLEA